MDFDYKGLLGYEKKKTLAFSEFIEHFLENPYGLMRTSASTLLESIKHFGYKIVVRSGEPVLSFNIFKDPFSNGINAVYGQETCIKRIIDVVDSVDKEAGPHRGIVLVGPPASGKTNIVDLVSQAVEEYTKQDHIKVYSFYYRLTNEQGRELELRSSLMPNPILLFPVTMLNGDGKVIRPRDELFEHLKEKHPNIVIPSYYQHASLDKRSLDILHTLLQNPINEGKSLFDIIEKYVTIEELEYSNAQGKGISNIDNMKDLQVYVRPFTLADADVRLLNDHLQGKFMFKYEGAMLNSNRGMLHIHDAFGTKGSGMPTEDEYKPLLMLLGSGKITLESTQASIDNTVLMTTNLEEMEALENHLTSTKMLDRIEKVPVNYLLDCIAEMDILKRDMSNIKDKYDLDPNLFKIAAYYSVMTRLMAPRQKTLPTRWNEKKKQLFTSITPEQKLFIYSARSEDPMNTVKKLPPWHPFRNECLRLGINIFDPEILNEYVEYHPDSVRLEDCGMFTPQQLNLIDDDFMRELRNDHYPEEGKFGLSIRQLQNIMRNTIVHSDGLKVTVSTFLNQLEKLITEGPAVHHWLTMNSGKKTLPNMAERKIGSLKFSAGEGNYDDYKGLIKVVKAMFFRIIANEITVCTVDRDPVQIENDLRKYLQHALLDNAMENKAFAHVIIPKYTYVDPVTGNKIDKPDYDFMKSIEKILAPQKGYIQCRKEMARKFLDLSDRGELNLKDGKPINKSPDDNLLDLFSKEYTRLLSHRRGIEGINGEQLRDAFFHMMNDTQSYEKYPENVKTFANTIIHNMVSRFNYSRAIALDTIIYGLRKNLVDFSEIIN